MTPFTEDVIRYILMIPQGKVATYGHIARQAGNPRAARQVSRILHSQSKAFNLPWQRVVNSKRQISLGGEKGELQKQLLLKEGVDFESDGKIQNQYFLRR